MEKVFDVVLELNFEFVTIVVLSHLELRLFELVVQGLESPFAHVPSLCATPYYYRLTLFLELNKLFNRQFLGIQSQYLIRTVPELLSSIRFIVPFVFPFFKLEIGSIS